MPVNPSQLPDLLPPLRSPQKLNASPLDEPRGPKGVTRQLRYLFREAFDQMGGVEWLVQFATANDQNARVFVQAISKLLPPASDDKVQDKIIIDVPWLTRDRLAYKRADEQPLDSDIIDVLPR